MAIKTYDSKEVFVIWGVHTLSGFAQGSKITVERDDDGWSKYVGSDGESARAKSHNKAGKVTVRLMQTSTSNDILSAAVALDEASSAGIAPLTIKDNRGNSLFFAESAWVLKHATADFAQEVGEREWVLDTGELVMFNGSIST